MGPKRITDKITVCRGPVSFKVELSDGNLVGPSLGLCQRCTLPLPLSREDRTNVDIALSPPPLGVGEPEVNPVTVKTSHRNPKIKSCWMPPEYYTEFV